jgi:hypothetical protein
VDLNLDTLKLEIQEYLNSKEFAVFRSSPGSLEGSPLVMWDAEKYPDYQMFLDVAQRTGTNLILFASREFEGDDLDDLLEQLDACGLTRDEYRDMESRLRELRPHTGQTCTLELAFDHNSRLYVYEVQPDWYQEYVGLEEDIFERLTEGGDTDEDDDPSLGGYYSKN